MKKVRKIVVNMVAIVFLISIIFPYFHASGEAYLSSCYSSEHVYEDYTIYHSTSPSLRFEQNNTEQYRGEICIMDTKFENDFLLKFWIKLPNINNVGVLIAFADKQAAGSFVSISLKLNKTSNCIDYSIGEVIQYTVLGQDVQHIPIQNNDPWQLIEIERNTNKKTIKTKVPFAANNMVKTYHFSNNTEFDGVSIAMYWSVTYNSYIDDISIEKSTDIDNNVQPIGVWFSKNLTIIVILVLIILIVCGLVIVKKFGIKKDKNQMEMEQPEVNTVTVKCPHCQLTFIVEKKIKPFKVRCPNCGKEGLMK